MTLDCILNPLRNDVHKSFLVACIAASSQLVLRRSTARAQQRHYIIVEQSPGKSDVEEALSKRGRFAQIRENLYGVANIDDGERRQRHGICLNPAEAEKKYSNPNICISKLMIKHRQKMPLLLCIMLMPDGMLRAIA